MVMAKFDTLYDENGEEIRRRAVRNPPATAIHGTSFSAKLLINKKDGTVIDVLRHYGGSMDPHDGKTVCTRQGTFDTILPLDEVASVTIGDTTIPVK